MKAGRLAALKLKTLPIKEQEKILNQLTDKEQKKLQNITKELDIFEKLPRKILLDVINEESRAVNLPQLDLMPRFFDEYTCEQIHLALTKVSSPFASAVIASAPAQWQKQFINMFPDSKVIKKLSLDKAKETTIATQNLQLATLKKLIKS